MASKMHLSPQWLRLLSIQVVLWWLIHCLSLPTLVFCVCFLFCYAVLIVHSSFAIISLEKRELVAFN